MKIERNIEPERVNSVQAARDIQAVGGQTPLAAAASSAPVVNLSGNAQNVQKLRDAVDQAPPVRSEKVEALRKKVQSGTLDIDTQKLADLLEGQLRDV